MVLIRLVSDSCRTRLDVNSETTSLRDLKEQIAKLLHVPADSIGLALDRSGTQCLIGDVTTLLELGITRNGQEIFVFSSVPREQPAQKPIAAAPSPPPLETPIESKKHKYQTFEDYLKATDYNVTELSLSKSFLPVKKQSTGPTSLPLSITLKHQIYRHVDHCEIMAVDALTKFVNEWRATDMLTQRVAYLIGYYAHDPHYGEFGLRAVAETLYEPPQTGDIESWSIIDYDPSFDMVLRVAEGLGLEIIGWVFTHLGRENLMTAEEFIKITEQQLRFLHNEIHYTQYPVSNFVTLTISPKNTLKGEPGSDAFMVSDLGLAMRRDNLFDTKEFTNDGNLIKLRGRKENEFMPTILQTAKEVDSIDVDWFIVRLAESAPKELRSIFKRTDFPMTNRVAASFEDVKVFLSTNKPAPEKLADFHFILFIALSLGYESAEMIIKAVKEHSDISFEFYTLLESLAS